MLSRGVLHLLMDLNFNLTFRGLLHLNCMVSQQAMIGVIIMFSRCDRNFAPRNSQQLRLLAQLLDKIKPINVPVEMWKEHMNSPLLTKYLLIADGC